MASRRTFGGDSFLKGEYLRFFAEGSFDWRGVVRIVGFVRLFHRGVIVARSLCHDGDHSISCEMLVCAAKS